MHLQMHEVLCCMKHAMKWTNYPHKHKNLLRNETGRFASILGRFSRPQLCVVHFKPELKPNNSFLRMWREFWILSRFIAVKTSKKCRESWKPLNYSAIFTLKVHIKTDFTEMELFHWTWKWNDVITFALFKSPTSADCNAFHSRFKCITLTALFKHRTINMKRN